MVQTRRMATDTVNKNKDLSYSDQLIKTFIEMAQTKITSLEDTTTKLVNENMEMRGNIESLLKRVQIQDGLIARLNSKISQQESQLTDLRARSMRDNMVFSGITEDKNEKWDDTKTKLQNFLVNELKIQDVDAVQIDRAHRSGVKHDDKPRPIIAKLANSSSKDKIFQNVKNLKGKPQYSIQEQLPAEVMERRKRLWSKFKLAKSNPQNKVSWSLDKLIINGVSFSAEDDKHEIPTEEAIKHKIYIAHTAHNVVEGSTFIGHAAEIKDKSDVGVVMAELMQDPMVAGSTHNIYAYRCDDITKDTGMVEKFSDDGEHGAGHKLLKLLQEERRTNVIVVVTRMYGNKHLGPKRFECIKTQAKEALSLI